MAAGQDPGESKRKQLDEALQRIANLADGLDATTSNLESQLIGADSGEIAVPEAEAVNYVGATLVRYARIEASLQRAAEATGRTEAQMRSG